MFCENCGNKMGDYELFCENCGTARALTSKQSNSSPPPNDPDKGVKFVGFEQKVPARGSWHLRNWFWGIVLFLTIIGLSKCSDIIWGG